MHAEGRLPYTISAKFGVDSSSRFPFRAHTQTYTHRWTSITFCWSHKRYTRFRSLQFCNFFLGIQWNNLNKWQPCLHQWNGWMSWVLWRCWLGGRKGIRPVKNWVVRYWRGCLGWGADLHIAYQMPLPLTISCSSKSRLVLTFLVFTFLVPAHPGGPRQIPEEK